jgi:regulator of protease activity HflC (stomatin/prohibitin superfamily)
MKRWIKNRKGIKMKRDTIIAAVIAAVILVLAALSIRMVRAGERGVLLHWGAVQDKVLGEGLYFIMPIMSDVVKIDVRTFKLELKASAFSKDLQSADALIALNYHISPPEANKLWQEIGEEYRERIIEPAIQEVVKAVTAKFNAQMLIEDRATVKKEIVDLLRDRLGKKYIVVDDVSIVNFDFSNEYEKAIENKQVAQQNALAAENVLRQREIEAKQRIATAQGEAEAIRIQADAISKQGGEAYIKIRAIDRWNGVLPSVVSGGEIPFLPISNVELKNQGPSK